MQGRHKRHTEGLLDYHRVVMTPSIQRTLLLLSSAVSLVAAAAAPISLATLSTPPAATAGMIGAPPGCKEGFLASAAPVSKQAVALPARGGATFSAAEEARWKLASAAQTASAPQTAARDQRTGDLARIQANASTFLTAGEAPVSDLNHQRAAHGMRARDAAFVARLNADDRLLNAVGRYLLQAAAAPVNDFTGLCFRLPDDSAPLDAHFDPAAWLLRYIVTYDYVRSGLREADRLTIENYIRRQAYFFATHLDWGLRLAFPNRLNGDYVARTRDAQPKAAADAFAVKRFDANGKCTIGPDDDATLYPVFAYVDGDGNPGPRISRLSQWFNNRRSASVAAFGTAGLLLGDDILTNRAKRYVMEWLTYSVWPDGSEGEYFRNGDYCIARQGLIYAQYNIQAAALLAHWLQLAGDNSLATFATTGGLFGTESGGGPAKSIASVVGTELQLLSGDLKRYYHEGWKPQQAPRDATNLGQTESRYMNSGKTISNHHALGILLAESTFPGLPVRAVLVPDAATGLARSDGDQGHRVATGYGQWQDVFGALPAVLLLK